MLSVLEESGNVLNRICQNCALSAKISAPRSRIMPPPEGRLDNALLCPYRVSHPGGCLPKVRLRHHQDWWCQSLYEVDEKKEKKIKNLKI